MANHYDIPKWAGKPPVGTHLDVMKEDKLVQKIMLDEKKCYLFGRNPQMNDICTDHQSCSRVHAAFVYHSILQRAFLVDLGSSHGTYIGNLKLEPNKPTQLPPNSSFHFGASTRHYIMRERPEGNTMNVIEQLERGEVGIASGTGGAGMLGLSQAFAELDNLTEFNTANNRRISMLGINDDAKSGGNAAGAGANSSGGSGGSGRKKKKRSVTFSEDYELINPEDVDPTVGRFRNMIHTTVVPGKRKYEGSLAPLSDDNKIRFLHHPKHFQPTSLSGQQNLYADLPIAEGELKTSNPILSSATAFRLGIPLPDPAPEVEITSTSQTSSAATHAHHQFTSNLPASHAQGEPVPAGGGDSTSPTKRVYAKEAWPGKKQMPPLLLAAPPVNPVFM